MSVNHSERGHALLSASGAHRWLVCTASPSMEKGIADTTSTFAEEGTFAHELSELHFAHLYQGMTKRKFNAELKKRKQNEYYSEELHDYVKEYVDQVEEHINEAKARADTEPTLMFEEQLDLSTYVPESFGTGDVIVYNGGVLEIIDLKFGKGIEVSAIDNPQLRLYGLGALDIFDMIEDVQEVAMTIIQPRLNNLSTERLPVEDLKTWGEDYVRPRAEEAWNEEGSFVPGEHCRFCKVKHTCKARANHYLNMKNKLKDPNLLSSDEIADILFEADAVQKWAKDVQDYALQQAKDGKSFEGWKVVEGRSRRTYKDEGKILELLKDEHDEDELIEKKLLSISKLEKKIGKKTVEEKLKDYIAKPPGKPALVPESDKRPEMNSADNDFDTIN
ncbi:DUF2800 domain-containing protein [Salimicrobium halophilum]|uniref:DUF2800 domain-containing protein n=1 Tax=Salimicrobium halophilum TaxID=86666 RepID=A0A1G8WF11_9BACI|nr:DUF2800 domain-containing protein [Salimicrobium halophilum]SDJ76854.1 Protein of unknown function [Salimicrobium halophilum]